VLRVSEQIIYPPSQDITGLPAMIHLKVTRSHLKIRILVQSQGGLEFQPGGILKYFEDLKRELNTGFEPKDNFEMASKKR